MSLGLMLLRGFINEGEWPCWVVAYIFNEYAALINLMIIRTNINLLDEERIEVKRIISLIRLIDGGAAIFHAVNKNHHIDRVGTIHKIPFVKYILRVLVSS